MRLEFQRSAGLLVLLAGWAIPVAGTPTGSITSPSAGATLSNLYPSGDGSPIVAVLGSAGSTSGNLSSWTLYYSRTTTPPYWVQIGSGTQTVTRGILGLWNTLYNPSNNFNPNGGYQLLLRVCETSGCSDFVAASFTVANVYLEQSFTAGSPQLNLASPSERANYTLRLPLSWPSSLSVMISLKNQSGVYVKSVGTTTTASSYQLSWDGTNTGGTKVADGAYFVLATVTDGTNTVTWDQSSEYLGPNGGYVYYDKSQAFDPWTGGSLDLSYNFFTGRVTIATSSSASREIPSQCPPPQGFCIVDHKYEESGPHTVQWVGVDGSGRYRTDVKWIAIFTETDRFAKNAVVVYGGAPKISNFLVDPRIVMTGTSQTIRFDVSGWSGGSGEIRITNQESGTVLRTISGLKPCITGHCQVSWDGRADNGMWVAPGGYTVTATVTDAIGNTVSAQSLTFIQY
jgi:flagellar hook assembly protein FlgD